MRRQETGKVRKVLSDSKRYSPNEVDSIVEKVSFNEALLKHIISTRVSGNKGGEIDDFLSLCEIDDILELLEQEKVQEIASGVDELNVLEYSTPSKIGKRRTSSTELSEDSHESDKFIMGIKTPGRTRLFGQTAEFKVYTPEKEKNLSGGGVETTGGGKFEAIKCTLSLGDNRSTTITKGQGRHVSNHGILIELLNASYDGVDIEEAIDKIYSKVSSYADPESAGMKQFTAYVNKVKADLRERGIISQEERKRLDEIDDREIPAAALDALEKARETRSLIVGLEINEEQTEKLLFSIDASIKASECILERVKEKKDIATPLDIRNKIKMADLWAHQRALINVVKAAMVVLNRMELVSFEGLEPKTRKELGEEGARVRKVMDEFRRGEIFDLKGRYKVAQMMDELFDYPVKDIIQRTEDRYPEKMNDRNSMNLFIEKEFFQALRRHEKLCYDSFKCLEGQDSDSILETREVFIEKVLDSGWKDFFKKNNIVIKNDAVFAKYNQGLIFEDDGSIKELTERFSIKESNSLRDELKKMSSVNEDFVILDADNPLEEYEETVEQDKSRHGGAGIYNPNKASFTEIITDKLSVEAKQVNY